MVLLVIIVWFVFRLILYFIFNNCCVIFVREIVDVFICLRFCFIDVFNKKNVLVMRLCIFEMIDLLFFLWVFKMVVKWSVWFIVIVMVLFIIVFNLFMIIENKSYWVVELMFVFWVVWIVCVSFLVFVRSWWKCLIKVLLWSILGFFRKFENLVCKFVMCICSKLIFFWIEE